MSKKVIPAKTILICDRCGNEGERGISGVFQNGGMHSCAVESWGIGYDGSAGGYTKPLDLCSPCMNDFERFLKSKT